MFQRFASALFGDDMEELSRCSRSGDGKEEEEDDEDWILVNYLGKSHENIIKNRLRCLKPVKSATDGNIQNKKYSIRTTSTRIVS